ncbi:MAG TPA: hypothetical protein VK871_10180 [Candidatus Limnocylindrales bacterium]|nr:hypothetical protein [Candidatus Limnocylindrales bacterium]
MTEATLTQLIREGTLDAELAALLWALAGAGVAVHVIADPAAAAEPLASALQPVARDPAVVTIGAGDALERVLALPVPLRPATGVVVVMRDGIVAAAHLLRPPLRDAGGHVRPQGPAVLATAGDGGWEHFAWGITPELAGLAGRPAGDFEIDQDRRREHLAELAEAGIVDRAAVEASLRGYSLDAGRSSDVGRLA